MGESCDGREGGRAVATAAALGSLTCVRTGPATAALAVTATYGSNQQ